MVQLEPQLKVLVSKDFLQTSHGEIDCTDCHGGNSSEEEKSAAHKNLDPHPSINDPEKACGDCHEEIVETAKNSLHATLSTFPTILKTRADMKKWPAIDEARQGHCASCHTSCGGCHVSRPKFAKKGFVNGHVFKKKCDPINQCTACHGSRVGNEFYGQRGQGDIHASKANMDCVYCHKGKELHAAAPKNLKGRYYLEEQVRCKDCHKDLEHGSVRDHEIHIGKVQCQVCHSQTYVNCYSCHTGRDEKGLAYFQNQKEIETLKIGRNYEKDAPDANYNYMLVRHVPVDLEVFDFYLKDAFSNFDNTPTWKRASPHNIQRKTWQAANCNNCHGNASIFLSDNDLLDYEKKANQKVIVQPDSVPVAIKKTMPLNINTSNVKNNMVVTSNWLSKNKKSPHITIIDARNAAAYKKGHIPGAISFDPLAQKIRTSFDDDRPKQLVSHAKISTLLGEHGIGAEDHLIVYDKDGSRAGFLLFVLDYAGAQNISILNKGIEGWHEAGHHLEKKPTKLPPIAFTGKEQRHFIADNDFVSKNLDTPRVAILDARVIHQAKGISTHGAAARGGHLPGSINLPLGALYMDNSALKNAEELLWVLKNNGLGPEKTVVTSCNTGQMAGCAFFILRYLGYPNVKVHDASWVGWDLD